MKRLGRNKLNYSHQSTIVSETETLNSTINEEQNANEDNNGENFIKFNQRQNETVSNIKIRRLIEDLNKPNLKTNYPQGLTHLALYSKKIILFYQKKL